MAHSLGSVLCYDILCNQPDLFAALPKQPLGPGGTPPPAGQPPQPKRPRHRSPYEQASWSTCLPQVNI
jgi:hypothetical protein